MQNEWKLNPLEYVWRKILRPGAKCKICSNVRVERVVRHLGPIGVSPRRHKDEKDFFIAKPLDFVLASFTSKISSRRAYRHRHLTTLTYLFLFLRIYSLSFILISVQTSFHIIHAFSFDACGIQINFFLRIKLILRLDWKWIIDY